MSTLYIDSYLLLLVVGVVFGMGGGVWNGRGCLSCSEVVFGFRGGVWNQRGCLRNKHHSHQRCFEQFT